MPEDRYTDLGALPGAPGADPLADLDLAAEELGPDLDPEVEEAAIAAFPELAEQPERLTALVDLIRMVGGT